MNTIGADMAMLRPLIAKLLIQVGADEPREIGTIEIPITIGIAEKTSTYEADSTFNP